MNIRILEDKIIEILDTVIDPEIGISIWKMGLIYKISIEGDKLHILMTLTSPACPFADQIFEQMELNLKILEEIEDIEVELTFDPAWNLDMMSEESRLEAGLL